jgi:glutamate racemase
MPGSKPKRSWTSSSEMTPDPIAFLDSGVGGLPYLAHTRRLLPGERYVYVADRENFPYGEKESARIVDAALSLTERLVAREHPRLVVVACNTMSVIALPMLRARFSLPFVGVVPAVKPAASLSRRRRVGVLATRQTV